MSLKQVAILRLVFMTFACTAREREYSIACLEPENINVRLERRMSGT